MKMKITKNKDEDSQNKIKDKIILSNEIIFFPQLKKQKTYVDI